MRFFFLCCSSFSLGWQMKMRQWGLIWVFRMSLIRVQVDPMVPLLTTQQFNGQDFFAFFLIQGFMSQPHFLTSLALIFGLMAKNYSLNTPLYMFYSSNIFSCVQFRVWLIFTKYTHTCTLILLPCVITLSNHVTL